MTRRVWVPFPRERVEFPRGKYETETKPKKKPKRNRNETEETEKVQSIDRVQSIEFNRSGPVISFQFFSFSVCVFPHTTSVDEEIYTPFFEL